MTSQKLHYKFKVSRHSQHTQAIPQSTMARACVLILALLFTSVAFLAISEARREPVIQADRTASPPPPLKPQTSMYQNPGEPDSVTPPPPHRPPRIQAYKAITPPPPPPYKSLTSMYQNPGEPDSVTPPPPRRPPTFMHQNPGEPDSVTPPPRKPPTFRNQNPGVQASEEPESVTPPPPRRPPTFMNQNNEVKPPLRKIPGTEANEEKESMFQGDYVVPPHTRRASPHGPPTGKYQTARLTPRPAPRRPPPTLMYQSDYEEPKPKPPPPGVQAQDEPVI